MCGVWSGSRTCCGPTLGNHSPHSSPNGPPITLKELPRMHSEGGTECGEFACWERNGHHPSIARSQTYPCRTRHGSPFEPAQLHCKDARYRDTHLGIATPFWLKRCSQAKIFTMHVKKVCRTWLPMATLPNAISRGIFSQQRSIHSCAQSHLNLTLTVSWVDTGESCLPAGYVTTRKVRRWKSGAWDEN